MEIKVNILDKPIMNAETCSICDNYDFTINRADQFMVSKKSVGTFYNIDPEDLWKLIEMGLNKGILNKVWVSDDEMFTEVSFEKVE